MEGMAQRLAEGKREYVLLGDLLKHDALFANYPNIRNVKVFPEDSSKGGFANGVMDLGIDTSEDEILNTILHEVQHYVQDVEDFLPGTSTDYIAAASDTFRWDVGEAIKKKKLINRLMTR